MDDDVKAKLISRYAIASSLSLLAYSILWYATDWMVVLGLFILHVAMNIEHNVALVNALWKFHNEQ